MTITQQDIHHATGDVMGGPWALHHVPIAGVNPDAVAKAALDALQMVDQQMSTYKNYSDLMRLNSGAIYEWLPIATDLHTVLACANDVSRKSDGAFNIALGGLVNAWGFGPDETPQIAPDSMAQRAAAAQAAIGAFALRQNPPSLRKDAPVALDLSGIAKGFAVDQAAAAVRAMGIDRFLVEAAGEIFATGTRPNREPWRVGLELPVPDKVVVFDHITLDGMSVATSGGYRNLREIDGEIYSHTISPLTGCPIKGDLLSVTVLNESCMKADAFATAMYVLGPDAGPKFAIVHDLAALFLIRDKNGFREVRSDLFVKYACGD
jgi:thiamine biosynthesis lipoprotein